MIGNLLARVFRGPTRSRRVSSSPIRTRRIAIEPLETRRLLAVTGSISGFALLPSGAGFPGLTVQLDNVDSQGNLSSVSGVGPTQTASDGSYSFNGLAAANYEILVSPSSKLEMGTPSPGSAGGTDSSNDIQLALASGQSATDYNFSVIGAQTNEISLRMFLASTGSLGQFLTSLHTAPSVTTGASSAATYTTGGSGLAIAPSATITVPDSPTLTSMSVTLASPPDGSSEGLAATTTGTTLTSSFAGDVLTVSGVADVSTYETVLQSVLYTDTAVPGTAGNRTLSITVNDGTDTSTPVTVTINVVEGTQITPSVTSVSPTSGTSGGGTVVTIDGSGFTSASTVDFGTTTATNVTFVSATQLTATAPAGAGIEDVTVTTSGETSATSSSDQFTYVPAVASVSPATGPASGGTVVTIDGTGFTSASTVDFGTTVATSVTDVSATQITATAPAGTVGAMDVTVTTSGETSATSTSDQFTYLPSVTSAITADETSGIESVTEGPASGGTVVTINGSGFTSASTVDFGTTPAASVTFVSATQLTATSPAGTVGTVNITVTTAGETSTTSSSDVFIYLPSVTNVSPTSGTSGGGTVVTIDGSGFTSASTVDFGTTAATNVTFVSATQLTAAAPAGAGVEDVTVTTSGETSATSSSDQFTYVPAVASVSPTTGPAGGGTVVTIDGTGFTSASTVDFGTTAATGVTDVSSTQITATAPAGTVGAVDVTVTTSGETSATSSSDQFTYVPSVTSVSASSGPASGGSVVTIDGSGFTSASTVDFGTAAATTVNFVSATQLTATAPAGAVGAVDVIVTTSGETSATSSKDQFTYLPSVTSVSPISGAAGGGTVVTIDGSGFTSASTVKFGATAATGVTFVSATQITATEPAGAGMVDVTVTTSGETSATSSSDQFTYVPGVTSVSPSTGPASGGAVVTIEGSGFTSASAVKFGTAAASSVTDVSSTQITATAPAGAVGAVDITVTTAGMTSATSSGDQFTYVPSVTGVSATSGPASGGTVVTIDGSGFTSASTVDFGTTAATNVTDVSSTQITATAPAGTVGTVDVTVTTSSEVSATSSKDQFTYLPSVTSVSPVTGPAGGGSLVTIDGSGFTSASTVKFGATAATGVTLVSATQLTATAPAGAGVEDVTVTTSGETSATSTSDQFTFLPSVTGVSPSSGPASGGSVVTINGSGFTAASTVEFGSTAASSVTFVSATQITATAPAEAVGVVDITVTTSGEISAISSSDQFTYLPSVASLSPSAGPASGGSVVTIDGSGFTAASTVEFGTVPATSVSFVSATQLTATAPAGAVGAVNITVTTAGETSAITSGDQFTYLPIPSVTSVGPMSGPAGGGTVVTIDGTGFTSASTVEFDSTAAANVTFVSATQLTATAPAEAVGTVDIAVITAGGTSATSSGDQFTYLPSVASVSPNSGAAGGGSAVTIDGSGFTATSTVEFGTVPATNVTFVSATQLTATAPAETVGAVDLTVTTAGETSATSSSDQFTYLPSVTGISPDSGAPIGGTLVTINGSGFTTASTVKFGATAATGVTFVSATQLTATAPAGTGLVDVTVTTSDETSATSSSDQFQYLGSVSSVTPSSGPAAGGTAVTIDGTGFTTASTVKFGTAAATSVTFVSATQLTATAPVGAGVVDVTVTTAGVTSATSSSDEFSYVPSVASISPTAGGISGGTVVTIDGTGFTAASTVAFGTSAATNVTYLSAGQITATAPVGTGIVDVTVTTTGETSATSLQDKFTYVANVTADQTVLGSFNDTAAGFTIHGGVAGETYSYTATSSGGSGVSVTGNGTLTSSTQDITGLNVSGLPAGTLTYTVTLSDSPGTPLTATVPYGIAPSGYSVAFDQPTYNATTDQNVSFTLKGAVVGDTYFYAMGTSQSVDGSGTVTSATESVTGIDLSSLASGEIFMSLVLKDPAGNIGLEASATATLNKTAPTGYKITADQSLLSPTTALNTGFKFSGATTGTTYNYTVTSSGGSGTVTGSGNVTSATQDVTGINVASLPSGTLTYSVTLTNTIGNTGKAATATATYYATAPSGYTITPDLSTLDDAAVSSAGFTLAGAEVGATYSYLITNSGAGPVIPAGASVTGSGTVTSATQDITGINLSSLADGAITYSVKLTDPVGNVGSPATAAGTIDRETPASIALSTSVVPSGQTIGTVVGLLQTSGAEATASYTYSLVAGGADNASFEISGDELLTNAVFSGGQSTFQIMVRSTDAQGNFIDEPFQLTLNNTDPVSPTLTLGNTTVAHGQPAGTIVGDLSTTGPVLGADVGYSLVSGTGSDNNSSFQIVNGQLVTTGPLAAGTYTVRVRSTSSYLLSDVVDLNGISGPTAYELSFDPTQLPSTMAEQVAANAGLISLMSNTGSGWNPAVTTNRVIPGSLATPNYQGSYASFWSTVTSTNPSATVANVVGSSGVDQTANTAWAVIDQPGEYAVGVQVFTEQTFTITVS
jgi:hypothetical protein